MAEYIDLDTPLEAYRLRGNQHEPISTTLRELLDFNKIPYTVADVVPVVRCRDCRHIHIGKDVYYCRYWERWELTPDGFCSVGAKMDGEA